MTVQVGIPRSTRNHPVNRPDRVLGLRRARAVTLLALALPGSMYLYQGEELGLPEVIDIPDDRRQDPIFHRSRGTVLGRDGSRVPLPWTRTGASFGFGSGGAHLPQPRWFADYSVEAQTDDPGSTLAFYREAIAIRKVEGAGVDLGWVDDLGEDVLAFSRPGGWTSATNFGPAPVALPEGHTLISSSPLDDPGQLPPDTTIWIRSTSSHEA